MFTPLRTKRKRQKLGAYDLEWNSKTGAITLAGFYIHNHYRAFGTVDALLDAMLVPEHTETYFYAHSGGRHDMTHIITSLRLRTHLNVECHVVGSRLIFCIVTDTTQDDIRWYLCDSFAVLKDSLKAIGNTIGLEKIAGDTDNMSGIELYRRNERDCAIVVKALEMYQEDLWKRGGELKHTIGACAMNLFRRSYMKKPVNTSKVDNLWCRKAYHASRVEVFRHRDENGIVRDINSAYPWAMTLGLPGDLVRIDKTIPDTESYWCADVMVTVPEGFVPPLPFRHKNRIYFPTGTFRTRMTRIMYELLLEYGRVIGKPDGLIQEVYEVHHYAPGLEELSAFATDMYNKRLAAKKVKDSFRAMTCKYEGNTPYGKLCERGDKQGLIINPEKLPPWEDRLCAGVYKVRTEREITHEHVIAGVWITDVIKAKITRALWILGELAAYCDTDCTHGPDMGDPDEDFLGGMKKEFAYAEAERIAAKLYILFGYDPYSMKAAAKGFAMPSLNVETEAELHANIDKIKAIFRDLKAGYEREFDWFATPRDAILDKVARDVDGEPLLIDTRSKRLSRQCPVCYRHIDTSIDGYDAKCPTHNQWGFTVEVSGKRARLDGGRTRPWTVDELKTRPGLS